MQLNFRLARNQEKEAAELTPLPLPEYRGEKHFQKSLDDDIIYRRLVLVSLAVAFVAGTGLGRIITQSNWRLAVFWSVTAIGLTACSTAPRPLLRRAISVIVVSSVFAWAWAFVSWGGGQWDPLHLLQWALAGGGVTALIALNTMRRSFVPVVATAIWLYLAADPWGSPNLHSPVWLHMPIVMIEFLLLIAAGYRYALAAMLRLPAATYRVAPLCVVPRLDRAFDYPVKINVV